MMTKGMYVEFYEYNSTGEKQRKIGQWIVEKREYATIYYHVSEKNHQFLTHPVAVPSNEIKRADIKPGTVGKVNNFIVTIIRKSSRKGKEGHALYYCLVQGRAGSVLVSESDLKVPFDAIDLDASELFLEGDFCAPTDFRDRYNIVKFVTAYSRIPDEYESIIEKKVELLEHQLETVNIRRLLSAFSGLSSTRAISLGYNFAFRSKNSVTGIFFSLFLLFFNV